MEGVFLTAIKNGPVRKCVSLESRKVKIEMSNKVPLERVKVLGQE